MDFEHAASLPDDGYGLLRTYASSTRLNLQHFLWKDTLGYNLHPTILIPAVEQDLKIADVGTGTAIWPIDVHYTYPLAHIDGFDISLDQCPPQEWLPKNVSVRRLDIFSPLPENLVSKYDIVNARLFLSVMKEDDPVSMLRNLVKMLKPGGYLQWSEHNFTTTTIASVGPERPDSAMHKINQMLLDSGAGRWVYHLSEYFSEQGFLNVRQEQYPIKPHMRSYFTHMTCMSVEDFTYAMLDNSSSEASGPRCRRLIQEAFQALKEGFALNYILETAVGRKPL